MTKTVPKPLPPAPKPKPAPKPIKEPRPPVYKPPKVVPKPPGRKPKPKKPVPPEFKPTPPPKFVKPIDKPIKQRFTWRDMVVWYRRNARGRGIRWNGHKWTGKPTFKYMVDYFIRVIGRKPSKKRYGWLYKIVQCVVRKEPVNNKVLRTWVQSAIRGRKNRNYKVPACVKHLWQGRLGQKPTYNDLASLIRFSIYNRKISYRALYLFTWSVLNEHDKTKAGHTEFWKRYAGIRSQYVSGLKHNQKFLIFNGQKKIVQGNTLRKFRTKSPRNYFFYDDNTKAIRWLGNSKLHLGVVGGLRPGRSVRLVRSRGKTTRRQDMFIYDSADLKFHNYVNKDLCIHFNNPNREGERMILQRCDCGRSRSKRQELLVKYYNFGKDNGFKPWSVFTLRSKANSRMALSVSSDGSLLLPSQRYAKITYGARN